jgi:FkbM family methyltransferase
MLATATKIHIARTLSSAVLLGRRTIGLSKTVTVKRRGIRWSLDLTEGIDFSIFLLGGFELRSLDAYSKLIKPGDFVLDIGANIGAHTLPLAQLVGPSGKVFSFEPSADAFRKQGVNIQLNPDLLPRIEANQMMLMSNDNNPLPQSVYSSWPLELAADLHKEHLGRLMSTKGAALGTVDQYVAAACIPRVDFIKLDVDGNELEVLLGARRLMTDSRPKIMLELAPYVYAQTPDFDRLLQILWAHQYQLYSVESGSLLPQSADLVRRRIPKKGGVNVLATARE